MDIQTEVQKIHHQFNVSEKSNYEIQKLFDKAIKEAVNKALRIHDKKSNIIMIELKATIIKTLKEFEQQDYKRGGTSIAPEMYNAIADKLYSRLLDENKNILCTQTIEK
jgi:hypothetical protein